MAKSRVKQMEQRGQRKDDDAVDAIKDPPCYDPSMKTRSGKPAKPPKSV